MALSRTVSGAEIQSGFADHPDHKIVIEPAEKRIVVAAAGRKIAETSRALLLREKDYAPVYYLPREDADVNVLTPVEGTTWCPFKGRASYFAISEDGTEKAAWSYEDPFEEVRAIKDHFAFYPTVATLTARDQ